MLTSNIVLLAWEGHLKDVMILNYFGARSDYVFVGARHGRVTSGVGPPDTSLDTHPQSHPQQQEVPVQPQALFQPQPQFQMQQQTPGAIFQVQQGTPGALF